MHIGCSNRRKTNHRISEITKAIQTVENRKSCFIFISCFLFYN